MAGHAAMDPAFGGKRGRATVIALLASVAILSLAGQSSQDSPRRAATTFNPANCDPEAPSLHSQLAFAGAQGFGRYARGGRGGKVFTVTTLADFGPGSLRECAEGSGPRTCVFAVSGTIVVDHWITVMHPYLTIAGQTSPGGIAIRVGKSTNSPMLVQAHDIIIRYLRLRPGPSSRSSVNVDTIQISGGAHDVILDHLSTSWPTDEGINIVGSGEKPFQCGETRNVTVQWSILSEGLNIANRGPHSRGTYFGYGARDVTFHHNLIASNVRRNPLVNMRGQFDMINNVIYNSARYNAELYTRFGALDVNMIGNAAIVGPSSDKSSWVYLANYFRDYPAPFRIYLRDNLDIHRRENQGDDRRVLEPDDWRYVQAMPVGRLSMTGASISNPGQAYRDVMAFAGAIKPQRDATDARVMDELKACRGAVIDDPAQVGGWPDLSGPAPPADRDADGIPDVWERAHGLSADDPADGSRATADGTTNLETYLGEMAGDDTLQRVSGGPDPDPTCGFPIKLAPPLPKVSLTAAASRIAAGETVELSWKGDHIQICKLAGAVVPETGTRTYYPIATTTYTISCVGPQGGDAIDSVVVNVNPNPHGTPKRTPKT